MANQKIKRRTTGETLDGTPTSNHLAQFNIVGSGPSASSSEAESSSKTQTKSRPKIVEIEPPETVIKNEELPPPEEKVIEISNDGTFEIPDEPDEPPELDIMESITNIQTINKTSSNEKEVKKEKEEEEPSIMDEMMEAANAARKVVKDKAIAEEKRVKKEFGGGLKKGFFNSTPNKSKSKKKEVAKKKSIETIKASDPPKGSKKGKKDFMIDEVQEAMKSAATPMAQLLSNQEWVTPDLLQKFATNPKLSKGLSDPRFQAAIAEMQKDPKAAMAKFQKDKELSEFLTEFFSTMGDHFAVIGEKDKKKETETASTNKKGGTAKKNNGQKPPTAVPVPERPLSDAAMKRAAETNATASSPEETAKMNEILQSEELRELLMDPDMQAVMMKCGEPGMLQFFMSDPKWGPKIRTLAKHGLVKIER